tara:strand:- start:955 stop:4959 length:4005 start_codon:yes stop_codon:yes gene_type:complete
MKKNLYFAYILLISNLYSGTIHVPADQPNIQAGIMWASNGDTVLVGSGTYSGSGNVDINFFGKSIHLLSSSGSSNTTIDLNNDSRGFYFNSGEDTTSIVQGFNIRNGYVMQNEGYIPEDYGYGGAVYIGGESSPKFIDCRFEYNDSYYRGDAISIRDAGHPIFDDCYFYENEHDSNEGSRAGGAVDVYRSNATFRNTTFERNGTYCEYDGGALYLEDNGDDDKSHVDIFNCQFLYNGDDCGNSYGGAIYNNRMQMNIKDSYFTENEANINGGAIYISDNSEIIHVDNSIFYRNGIDVDQGGAIYQNSYSDTLYINQSTFSRNGYHTSDGGAIRSSRSKLVINNTDITQNHAEHGSGVYIYSEGNWENNYYEVNFSTIANNYNRTSYSHNTNNYLSGHYFNGKINNSITNWSFYSSADNNNLEESNNYTSVTDYRLFLDHHHEYGHFRLAAHSPAIGLAEYDDRFQYDRDGRPRPEPGSASPDAGCYESTRNNPAGAETIYVSPDGDDEFGSGESDNPYKTLYMAVRASHYDFNDVISLAPGTYNEDEYIRLRGRKVNIQSQQGSDSTVVVFNDDLAFSNQSFFSTNYPDYLYDATISGIDIRLNSGTSYGIYMYDSPIHLNDVIIEDEIYSEKTGFNINGLRSHTNEGLNYGLIKLYNYEDNEDFTYNFSNLDISTSGSSIIYFYNQYNSNNRDMNVYVSNSDLRSGSTGSGDVFANGCCDNWSNDDRIYITDSFVLGEIYHRGLRHFEADRTVFKNTRFEFSDNGSSYIYMENCTIDNGYFNFDADGLIKNTIFYPNIEFDNYQNESDVEFQYCLNIPEDAPTIGVYNISGEPLFVDIESENYNLMPASPCIDTADADNDDDGSNWDQDSNDQDPDGSRLDMGAYPYNHYGAYEPEILSVIDVPDDQGGLVNISWTASPNDVQDGNIIHYGVWRVNDAGDDVLSLVPAAQEISYNYFATTVNDSIEGNTNFETFYITAHTIDLNLAFTSETVSGYSIDNIAPSVPEGFLGSNNNNIVMLSWDENNDEDFDYYSVYRNGIKIADLSNTYFEELSFGDLEYYVTATDYNGNESEPSNTFNISLNQPGDVNIDDVVNVFDVVLMVEYILDPESSDFGDLEFGLADSNYDGELNILDIMYWVNVVLGLGREDLDIAQSAKLFIYNDQLLHKADGLVGYHFTISHDIGLELILTQAAMISESATYENLTEIVILNPESDILFTTDGDFKIIDVACANSLDMIDTDIVYVPDEFRLRPAYPNPFNPVTNISVDIPEEMMMTVNIFDINGRLIESLLDNELVEPGHKIFMWDANNQASGIYFIYVKSMKNNFAQRITLLK